MIEVMVLPFLQELLFDLSEDFSTLSLLESRDSLQSLAHEVAKFIIEALPLNLDVIANDCCSEIQLRTVSHVRVFTESFR